MTNRRYFEFIPGSDNQIHPLINFMLMAEIGFGALLVFMHMILAQTYVTDGFLLIVMAITWLKLYMS